MNRYLQAALGAAVASAVAMMTASCTLFGPVAAGSSSETIVGKVAFSDGTPAANTQVTLYPMDYDPVADTPLAASSMDTTDDSGTYSIEVPDSWVRYMVTAVHRVQLTRAMTSWIAVEGDVTRVQDLLLFAPGVVKVTLPDTADTVNGYLYIPGTGIAADLAGSGGFALLDSVPAGTVPSVSYAVRNSSIRGAVRYSVRVPSGDTVVVRYPAWQYARDLCLNTAGTGADVAGNAYGFAVLIRLTDTNFSFARAQSGGGDIRFAKTDGTLLPYEIDRWDASGGSAEVWVRVDTVFGGSSTQTITMYWGNAGTASASDGNAVFTEADSCEAVWHCDSIFSDATGNGHAGIRTGTADTAGIIGRCQKFNGSSAVTVPGLLHAPATVTLAAWASLDAPDVTGSEVVSLGDAVLLRMDDHWKNKGTQGAYCIDPLAGVDSTHSCDRSGRFFERTGWHYLVYSVDIANSVQSLYIDGTLCCSTASAVPIVYTGIGTNTYLGKHGNGRTDFDFIGRIDEVRVDKTARSADWIKLCYMNQRADDRLVMFR